MRAFIAFFKKEFMESLRSGKLLLLLVLFVAFGIMNPAIAKMTPWLLEIMAEEMAESGMTVTTVSVDALTSWTQFFKNIPMALIAFVLIYSSSFTKEYESQTLVIILTKGLSRYKVVLSKALLMLSMWSAGFWICFGVTYAYNAYFWDNSIATGLMPAVINWWLFSILVVSLTVLFSVLFNSYSGVLLGTGGVVLASYLAGLLPKATKYMPTSLINSGALMIGEESIKDYLAAIVITTVASVACIVLSIPVFNKKQL